MVNRGKTTDGRWRLWTLLDNGFYVSTVQMFEIPDIYLGYKYETMVFKGETDLTDIDCRRCNTQCRARRNHIEMVRMWAKAPHQG